jgi:hypothetical protein
MSMGISGRSSRRSSGATSTAATPARALPGSAVRIVERNSCLTEGGIDRAGIFHRLPRLDDARLAEIFGREVLAFLVSKGLLSPEWAERILSWRHTGFNVHSRVRARTKAEAERVGKYMVRPILALDRLLFLEREGKVGYRVSGHAILTPCGH